MISFKFDLKLKTKITLLIILILNIVLILVGIFTVNYFKNIQWDYIKYYEINEIYHFTKKKKGAREGCPTKTKPKT